MIAPSRVADVMAFWTDAPLEYSTRCLWWRDRITAGWRPNKRIRSMGYHESAKYFGVYIWEWLNVIGPQLELVRIYGR